LNSENLKPILLISASDSSAAAGMQMDLRVLNDLGVGARCAITAVTVQGDGGAKGINPVDPGIILASINTALADHPGIGAVKVGLLGDVLTAQILEDPLSMIKALDIPIVVDPVMKSTTGSALSTGETVEAILEKILPRATLLTPNRDELAALGRLTGVEGGDEAKIVGKLRDKGAHAILVTGGDTDDDQCVDVLYETGGETTAIRHPRIGERTPRGTGCALSTSIAVHLGRGLSMAESVERSIEYVTVLIENAFMVGNQLLLLPGKVQFGSTGVRE